MLTSVFSLQRFFKMLISCYCVIKKKAEAGIAAAAAADTTHTQ